MKRRPTSAAAVVFFPPLPLYQIEGERRLSVKTLVSDRGAMRLKDEEREEMKKENVSSRRSILKVAGAGLVAAAIPSVAAGALKAQTLGEGEPAQTPGEEEPRSGPKPVYLHGCGWNRDLPGVFGELCLTFEMRADLAGTGLGTFRDDVHPEVNSQFQVNRVARHGKVYTFDGEIIASRDPSMLGMAVRIVAEKTGDGKGKATITVGSEDRDLVVIAIIAILIALLVPAVQ